MKLVKNTGSDRVIDELRRSLVPPSSLDLASSEFSLFAYGDLRDLLEKLDTCRIVPNNIGRGPSSPRSAIGRSIPVDIRPHISRYMAQIVGFRKILTFANKIPRFFPLVLR